MDGQHCDCDHDPLIRGKHDRTPCPIHGEKGKAAWDRLEARASYTASLRTALERIESVRERYGNPSPYAYGSLLEEVEQIARAALSDTDHPGGDA